MTPAAQHLVETLADQPDFTSSVIAVSAGLSAVAPKWDSLPLVSFYMELAPGMLTTWMLTPGRVIRAQISENPETGATASLTVTVPISRVSRVVDEVLTLGASARLTTTVELDAEALVFEPIMRPTGDVDPETGSPVLAVAGQRLARTSYAIVAADPESFSNLAEFSRQVRLALDYLPIGE